MHARIRFVLCTTDNNGKIYFAKSPDGYAWPQPETPLFGGMTTSRPPALVQCGEQLHMILAGSDGQILHSVYDQQNDAWPTPDPNDQTFAGYRLYSNGGYATPALVGDGNNFSMYFVDDKKALQTCAFNGSYWSAISKVDFEAGQTEDTPAFVLGGGYLLMCAADTSGQIALYAPAGPEQSLTSWNRVSAANVIDGISTWNNRSPTLLIQNGSLTLLALDRNSVVQTASWPLGKTYATAEGQPLFAGDDWKCSFPPVGCPNLDGPSPLCLCDNRGRVYFAQPQGGGWIHPDEPFSWWNGWETWGSATPSVYHFDLDPPVHPGYSWMKDIPDATQLSSISIPGTHDSLTYTVSNSNPGSQCQTMSLLEQLQCGVRYLDFRAEASTDADGKPDFDFYHGITPLGLTFKEVYPVILGFLAAFPSETVILCLNEHGEGGSTDDQQTYLDTLNHFVQQNPGSWHLNGGNPWLAEARGKIVLFRRFAIPPGQSCGVDLNTGWNNNSPYDTIITESGHHYFIQDDYEWDPARWTDKVAAIDAMLDDAVAQTMGPGFYFTFTNAASGGTPVWFSAKINPKVIAKLDSLQRPSYVGMVGMDYVEEAFVRRIFLKNFEKTQ